MQEAGMEILIDFHFSDSWQILPTGLPADVARFVFSEAEESMGCWVSCVISF